MHHRALSRKFLRIINRFATRRPLIVVPRAAFAQPLEPRRLLSALVINGGSGNDDITIRLDSNFIYATVNGIQIPQPRGLYDAITVNCLGGNDNVLIQNTGTGEPIDIFPGDGADTILVCAYQSFDASDPPTNDLDQIVDRVYVHAGTDATDDTLDISDALDAGSDAYNIVEDGPMKLRKPSATSPDKVFWGESNLHTTILLNDSNNAVSIDSSVAMDGTDETLTLGGGIAGAGPGSRGNDTFTFSGEISNGNLIEFFGGDGNNTFLVTGASFSTSATLSIDGGAGNDLLTVTDSSLFTNSYDFNSAGNRLSLAIGANALRIDYNNLETIALNSTAPNLNSTFNIDGLDADLVAAAGGGNDTFVVGDGAISTSDFGTNIGVTLLGGGGNDSVTFDDSASSVNQGVTFGNETFDHNNLDTVVCSAIAKATINLGSGNETVTLGSDHGAFAQIIVNGGAGTDTFDVQPVPGTLITVNGQSPTTVPGDSVHLSANGQSGGIFAPNTASDGAYVFPNGADIFYTGMESFTQPDSALAAPDLARADDTGRSDTDNVTKKTSLSFSGTGANGTVRLFRDGTQIATTAAAANGSYTFSAVSFPTGDNTFAMTVADDSLLSGLIADKSLALNVHVDTLALPVLAAPDLLSLSDSGKLNTDNLTNVTTPFFIGTPDASAIVHLLSGGIEVGSGTLNTFTGIYEIQSSALTDGAHSMTVSQEDIAGNVSNASAVLVVTIDTAAPAAPTAVPDLQAASDSGLSSTDNITNDNTPTFTVNGPELIRLFEGITIVADYAAPPDVTSDKLNDGLNTITARSVDLAGNASAATSSVLVTIDTKSPGAPSTPDLIAASDSGVSNNDNITKVTTPTFAFNGADRIRLLDGTTVLADYAEISSVTSSALADGFHNISARSIDVAGNVSNITATLGITIDTQRPVVSNAAFAFDAAQAINYTFSEDVSPTVALADFSLQNRTTPTAFPPGSIALSASPGNVSSFATVTFPGFAAGLADGNYGATLTAAGITDLAGNALANDNILDFFVLAGDANHDRAVGFADLVVVAQHYGQTAGTTFSTGDLNYDGTIGFADLVLVAQHYGTTLTPPAAPAQGVIADAAFAPVRQAAATRSLFSLIPVKKALRRPPSQLRRG